MPDSKDNNYPYCLAYNSSDVKVENLVFNQVIILYYWQDQGVKGLNEV